VGPSNWQELTDRQSIALTRLRNLPDPKRRYSFIALKLLYGFRMRHQRWLFDINYIRRQGIDPDDQLLLLEQGQNLLKALAWISEADPSATFPAKFRRFDYQFGTPLTWLKKQLSPQLYVGPDKGLSNGTFAEFMAADKAYQAGDLPLLAAILYRPLDASGHRIAFGDRVAKEQSKRFASLEPALLERIGFAFCCTKITLQKYYRLVFPDKMTDELSSEQTPVKSRSGTWLDVVIGMAKFDVTKIEQIEQINLYLALKVLNEQLRQAEEMEAQLAKMKQQH
jgi:hypothetical protein